MNEPLLARRGAPRSSSHRWVWLVLALACSAGRSATTAPASDPRPPAGSRLREPRPLHARCETTFEITGPLSAPQIGFTMRVSGLCEDAALGRTTLEAHQTVVIGSDGTETITHTGTLTATDGDAVHARFSGVGRAIVQDGVQIGVGLTGTEQYAGGTGRFADASGSAELVGAALFDPPAAPGSPPGTGKGHYTVSGTISY